MKVHYFLSTNVVNHKQAFENLLQQSLTILNLFIRRF